MNFIFNKISIVFKGRTLNEHEKLILISEEESRNSLLSNEEACFALGSSIELIDQILNENNSINNGIAFVKSFADINHYTFESLLTEIVMEKHNLKRCLFLNWDIDHNLSVQKKFYESSR